MRPYNLYSGGVRTWVSEPWRGETHMRPPNVPNSTAPYVSSREGIEGIKTGATPAVVLALGGEAMKKKNGGSSRMGGTG